jgi:thioredoxin reductase (NADPH)
MAKPIIMTIDDEPHVLNAIARDLQAHYQSDYRIVKASSGIDALETVQEFKRRNDPIALFLADQRMPSMSGVEFLEEAIKLYPETKRVLLTAYADTDAAIASINAIGLDYYLMKPWDPPEERLYPVLDDLLSDWLASVPVPYDGIRVAGTLWSASSHDVKEFLARSQIPYEWLDIERDSDARELVEASSEGRPQLPTVFFPDGSTLMDPDQAAGGQAGTSARIENYLGFPQGISGADLTRRATTQVQRLGAEILTAREVTGVRVEEPYKIVTLNDGRELSCHALMIATGVTVRELDVPGIEDFIGGSVYYGAATSEAVHYKDKKVFVVGGANSAGQGAMFLSRFASEVTVLIRGDSLQTSMSQYLIDQIDGTDNISLMTNTEVTAVKGTDRLEEITVKNKKSGESETLSADAVFIFIGAVPHTDVLGDVVELDEAGFVFTGQDLIRNGQRPRNWKLKRDPMPLETSVPGIFAAGDVRHGVIRRVASAVGQGAVAVSLVHKYLETV